MREYIEEEQNTPIFMWCIDVNNHSIHWVEAFPRITNTYWVPSVGTMATYGITLFDTKEDAINEAKAIILRKIEALARELADLKVLECS